MTNESTTETKKTKGSDGANTDPVHVIRDGGVAASIWQRMSPTGFAYYEYSLSRSWKSVNTGRAGYSKNFFSRNEPELLKVIGLATQWISEKEALNQTTAGEALAA